MTGISRRRAVQLGLYLPVAALAAGCRASLPVWSGENTADEALSLLHESAAAHGSAAFAAVHDVNVSYAGHWRRLVGILQPVLVDSGFRGGSEERLLVHQGVVAQSHSGPKGRKQVVRVNAAQAGGSTQVWLNHEETHDRDIIDAAALVADAYALFLLGPMLLDANSSPHRDISAQLAGGTEVKQDEHRYACDLIDLIIKPGIGDSKSDQLVLYIDRESRLMRRVRMTLNGLESTQGALVDIDTFDHRSMHGIMWPTTFHERLLRPAPLDVHAWKLTGLDINRGESPADLTGSSFLGKAATPASPLTS